MTASRSKAETLETADGVEYTPHSMMHKAIVRMDETILEMLDGFERTDAGHKFVPEDSNVRVILTGRDWSEKRVLVYGSTSTEEAKRYVQTIIDRVREIEHEAELVDGPEITNIAVSGDLGNPIELGQVSTALTSSGIDVEYEPEQFPAAIVKLGTPSVTFLLFSTGGFVIQGLRSRTDIEPAIETMQDHLAEHTMV